MSEVDGKSGGESDESGAISADAASIGRALGDPRRVRGPLMARLSVIVQDPSSAPGEVLAAAGVLLAASKINLANIATSINAEIHEELELRVTNIEQLVAARDAKERPYVTKRLKTSGRSGPSPRLAPNRGRARLRSLEQYNG